MSAKSPGLEAELRARIAAGGPLGFDEFMAAALYHPRHGYYASGIPRTGKHGDFFTSVSVGPVFGKLLAAQFLEMRGHLGDPQDFTLVEQGANDGQLMADILAAWKGTPPRILIVEPIETLRTVQRKTLAKWSACVSHVAHESELPDFEGVFFANELLDAFPVKIFAREVGKWCERRVTAEGDRFVFTDLPTSEAPSFAPRIPEEAPTFVAEFCPSLAPWMYTIAGKLRRGWIFLIDYGQPAFARYHPARANGTLAAYRSHRRMDDPLADPGHQDLTAHVDFTAVAEAGEDSGLRLAGFTDQHHALTAIAARVFPSMPADRLTAEAEQEMRALRQLLHPESMGTSFKFLALAKNADGPLAAFAFARDPRAELFA